MGNNEQPHGCRERWDRKAARAVLARDAKAFAASLQNSVTDIADAVIDCQPEDADDVRRWARGELDHIVEVVCDEAAVICDDDEDGDALCAWAELTAASCADTVVDEVADCIGSFAHRRVS